MNNAAGNLVIGATGTLQFTAAALQSTNRSFTVSNGSIFDISDAAGNLVFTGSNSGAVAVNKIGAGVLTLGGAADNIGLGVTVNAGTVVLGKTSSGAMHALGAATNVNSGGTLKLGDSGNDQFYDPAAFSVNSGGTFDLFGKSETINNITLIGTGVGGNGALINSDVTPSTLTGAINSGASRSFTVGGSGDLTLSGAAGTLPNSSIVTKIGAGAITFSGAGDNFGMQLTASAGAPFSSAKPAPAASM